MSPVINKLKALLPLGRNTQLALLIAACAVSALAIGYIWPYSSPLADHSQQADWQSPTATHANKTALNLPAALARFWPLSAAQSKKEPAAAAASWKLVGVIRQGSSQRALVLNPSGTLLTLDIGDQLDDVRLVTAILPTELHWQSGKQQGILPLFAKPKADNSNLDSSPATTHE